MLHTFCKFSRNVQVQQYFKQAHKQQQQVRTFLSHAYYCNEVWQKRLNASIIKNVKPDDLYHELDQVYQRTKNLSAIDVDIYANSLVNEGHQDELLDIIHKLRLSADTSGTLNSTSHAVVRYLISTGHAEQLLAALDDRLNYGLFVDSFTANILMDTFWKRDDYLSGVRVASQMMLQEDFDHKLTAALALLHCYKFLLNPIGWPEVRKPEEPVEEVKVRVKYIRNEFFDDHFDLRDPLSIVGKTIGAITSELRDTLDRTLRLVGLAYYKKDDQALALIDNFKANNRTVYSGALDMLPDDSIVRTEAEKLQKETGDVVGLLTDRVNSIQRDCTERDITEQCKAYSKWEDERIAALERQRKRLDVAKRLADVEASKVKLQEDETKLWYFENEEKIELEIDSKKIYYRKRWFGKKKKPRVVDEGYIPPEIQRQQS